MQATLEQAILLDLLPRSDLEVFIQVLQADGGERAACVNAAVLAVANAGKVFGSASLNFHCCGISGRRLSFHRGEVSLAALA